jgi:2-C-methyl-D-erythritol 4-phosphate cytidylyltransferase/2-C-methyl-D-erythritol 2,4-cyclodiphosphate synthase
MNVAVVLAAGSGERLGGAEPKAMARLGKMTLLELACTAAVACPAVDSLVVTAPSGHEDGFASMLEGLAKPVIVVTGGATRQDSVHAALQALPGTTYAVAVHDSARCMATPALFGVALAALAEADGAVPVLRVLDTVKRVEAARVVETIPRDGLALAQTPQAFRFEVLRDLHERAAADGLSFTDDAGLLEWGGCTVAAVPGEPGNFKITTPTDLERAKEAIVG